MSELWLDQKFASIAGTQLEQFKVTKTQPYMARFRCPICGDSKQNKFKTRGHFYEYKGSVNVKCFNCNYSSGIGNFLKNINPTLYSEYRIETLREAGKTEEPVVFKADIEKFSSRRIDHFEPFSQLKKISQLPPNHPAKLYIINRKIPSNTHYRIYYSHTYCAWVNQIIPNKFSEKALAHDEPRIVFPFIDSRGYVFGMTGRSLNKESRVRYSTIIFDDTKDKIFGAESIDRSKPVYVVEGPIDSLFLTNCVAMAGSDVKLQNIATCDRLVVVYDNEPRNGEIVKKIRKAVEDGYKVCIWPDHIEQKDINDMILVGGYDGSSVQAIIDQNTFQGLAAKMRLQQWSKV
ncbi:DNA primase [uncultured Caudovirales phage]|uniref:DNA primase n=1 Tax=uncultured Caudovirales phage TaxID=2100421 RepID=A0A6J7WTN6_9CAUD|nr:DNA primase [uncultured Caudovirales phage]